MFIVYSTNTSKGFDGGYDTNITLVGIAENMDIVNKLIKNEKENLYTTYSHVDKSYIDKEYTFEYKEVNNFALNTNISVDLY